jgi:diaminopimelate epimerase
MDGLAAAAAEPDREDLTRSAAGADPATVVDEASPAGRGTGAACPPKQARAAPPPVGAWLPAALGGAAFWKMSGGGNDFVVFDNREGWFPKGAPGLVAGLCARGLGVGADAVLLLEHAATPGAAFRMVYFNADGGEAPMCGNGALCIARLARELGLVARGEVEFETGAGRYRAELFPDSPSRVRLAMRDPTGVRPSLPEIEARGYIHAGFADTGTPHLIALVPDLAGVDVTGEGAALRHHSLFQPAGTNVNFAAVLGRGELAIRTYERGVEGETLSCGTGAAAAALLTHLWELTCPPVLVHPPGGLDLVIGFEAALAAGTGTAFRNVTLEGDARIVFSGTLPLG